MTAISRRRLGALTAAGAFGALVTACGSEEKPAADGGAKEPAKDGKEGAEGGAKIEIEDNHGKQSVPSPAKSVICTDNRSFEVLAAWDVKLSAAPKRLIPKTIEKYKNDDSILDMGNHKEPDLEKVVEAKPDLIINGQRFRKRYDKLKELAPQAAIVEFDPRDGKPFDEELKRQVTSLGTIFGKEDEAKKLVEEFEAAIERAKKAYKKEDTVMAVITSGGEIGYVAPSQGRALGPVFDLLGMTPALKVEGASKDHKGDDISVEAIADSNPHWILVMDRDAAIAADKPEYKPAAKVIEESQALTSVTAVSEGNIVYMPADTYTNESIQTYTEFFNSLADAFEAKA